MNLLTRLFGRPEDVALLEGLRPLAEELNEKLRVMQTTGLRNTEGALTAEVVTLKQQVADLEIAKSKLEEGYARREREQADEFARQEREIRHLVGLEKQRQEQERQQMVVESRQAAKDATLTVREENLAAERKRFEEQLAFNTERFKSMEVYLKDMMGSILERLPNVSMDISRRERTSDSTRVVDRTNKKSGS